MVNYMSIVEKNTLRIAFEKAGIQSGDTVLLYSDISCFGKASDNSPKTLLKIFYDTLSDLLGKNGTICAPAYYYEYARYGMPYDIKTSPISNELGLFPKFINSLDNSKRSPNPITAITAVGKNADYICEIVNRHSYGEDSAYDRLYKLNSKIVLLGPQFNNLTFWHYVEYRVGVAHTYNKIYNIPVLYNGKTVFDYTIANVRYLNKNVEYNFLNHEEWLKIYQPMIDNNTLLISPYLNSSIYMYETCGLFNLVKDYMYHNPYYLIIPSPNFPFGEIPNDGPKLFNK